jgi:hypothetical protein
MFISRVGGLDWPDTIAQLYLPGSRPKIAYGPLKQSAVQCCNREDIKGKEQSTIDMPVSKSALSKVS